MLDHVDHPSQHGEQQQPRSNNESLGPLGIALGGGLRVLPLQVFPVSCRVQQIVGTLPELPAEVAEKNGGCGFLAAAAPHGSRLHCQRRALGEQFVEGSLFRQARFAQPADRVTYAGARQVDFLPIRLVARQKVLAGRRFACLDARSYPLQQDQRLFGLVSGPCSFDQPIDRDIRGHTQGRHQDDGDTQCQFDFQEKSSRGHGGLLKLGAERPDFRRRRAGCA